MRDKRANSAQLALRFNHTFLRNLSPSWWNLLTQNKHHRWQLDGDQVRRYHLGSALHTGRRWWEDMEVQPRELSFVTANGWLTICPLVCEDLARQEPVAEVVRAVGPTLVVALLLDGPQLEARWPARYASVLADDPGCSVLTLTSLGMVIRSRPPGKSESRVVGLWKDPKIGAQELTLERGSCGLLLSLCADWVEQWSADGRSDRRTTAELTLSGVEQIP